MSLDALPSTPQRGPVFFDRREFERILRVYGRGVAAGQWRDYSVVGHDDAAEFAIFHRSGDAPLYRIEKRPALQRRQGQWAVFGAGGQVLKRGRELEGVLKVFEAKRFTVVE